MHYFCVVDPWSVGIEVKVPTPPHHLERLETEIWALWKKWKNQTERHRQRFKKISDFVSKSALSCLP